MIFEKLPSRPPPSSLASLCLCCCECLLLRFVRPFSIFDIDYGVDDGDLSISSPAHPSPAPSSALLREKWIPRCDGRCLRRLWWCCVRDLHRRLWMTFLNPKGVQKWFELDGFLSKHPQMYYDCVERNTKQAGEIKESSHFHWTLCRKSG